MQTRSINAVEKARGESMTGQLKILLVLTAILAGQCWGQQKPKPKALTLEDVLSCADDRLISGVFALDGDNVNKLIPQTKTYDQKLMESYGFWILVSPTAGKQEFIIMSKEKSGSFCRSYPTMSNGFATPKNGTTKYLVTLFIQPADAWTLDPNEVFAHADQFTFESGVFENSTEVFLIAKRGVTSIQFIFSNKKLKLYRVFYDNPKFN